MSRFIPTTQQYNEQLDRLTDKLAETNDNSEKHRFYMRGIVMLRLPSETGIAREEMITIKRSDLDRDYKRGLWIEKAKKIKVRGKKEYTMRQRNVPVNRSLYTLLKSYMDTHTSPYIIDRIRDDGHSTAQPLTIGSVNDIFTAMEIPWSPHDCRHYFRKAVRTYMMEQKAIDIQTIKEILGHTLTIDEQYGGETDFDYKLKLVDAVF